VPSLCGLADDDDDDDPRCQCRCRSRYQRPRTIATTSRIPADKAPGDRRFSPPRGDATARRRLLASTGVPLLKTPSPSSSPSSLTGTLAYSGSSLAFVAPREGGVVRTWWSFSSSVIPPPWLDRPFSRAANRGSASVGIAAGFGRMFNRVRRTSESASTAKSRHNPAALSSNSCRLPFVKSLVRPWTCSTNDRRSSRIGRRGCSP
jgi:hypothetical protein